MASTDESTWLEAPAEAESPESQRLRPRRYSDESEMDITPMIDITFLLLIFFVVASKIEQSADVELPPARFGVAVATRNAVIVTVAPGSGQGPAEVYKGDKLDPSQRIDAADLEDMERQLEAFVADEMLVDPQKRLVLVKAAGALKHREVARVTQAVSRVAEVTGLHIAVLEEQ